MEHTDKQGRTALMLAAEGGHLDMVKMLVEAGANLLFASRGRTAEAGRARFKEHLNISDVSAACVRRIVARHC